MDELDPNSTRRKGFWTTLAIAAATGAGAVTIALPVTPANADPVPAPPGTTTAAPQPATPNAAPDAVPGAGNPNAAPVPADPNAAPPGNPNAPLLPPDPNAPPPPPDPNAPPPAADPNAPEPGRIGNAVGGFTYVMPAGWVESDATHLDYGSALLSKEIGPAAPGQPPLVANDTRVVLGRLDQRLYAGAEPDNTKAATRLASDMGEFFMPYPGTRINQESTALKGNGVTGSASFYEVKFSDPAKPNGQIWAGVVGTPNAANAGAPQRWFVVWLGTANDPVDKGAATTLAQSILPWTPPPAPAAPPPPPGFPPPAPIAPPPAPGAPPPAPNVPPPAQAPAGEIAPGSAPTPQGPVAT